MTHYQFKITKKQKDNLLKLAKYLLKKYPRNTKYFSFDMGFYYVNMSLPPCGTVCCAAGHGPKAGIGVHPLHKKTFDSWAYYVSRHFTNNEKIVYEWCFAGHWAAGDNTPRGAAKRILYMLKYGVPSSYHNQQAGRAPLCYTKIKLSQI